MSRVYRATIRADRGGILEYSSLHYQTDVPPLGGEPDPDDVANGVWGVIGTQFLALCPTTTHVTDLVVTEETLSPDIGAQGVYTINQDGILSVGSSELPTGICPVVRLRTATHSRSARGWTRPPGPRNATHINGNVWATTYKTTLDAYAAVLDNSFDLGSVTPTHVNPVVYSRTRRLIAAEPWTFRVTAGDASPVPHWLRSRMTLP